MQFVCSILQYEVVVKPFNSNVSEFLILGFQVIEFVSQSFILTHLLIITKIRSDSDIQTTFQWILSTVITFSINPKLVSQRMLLHLLMLRVKLSVLLITNLWILVSSPI